MITNKQLTTITFLSCIREAINLSVEGMEGLGEGTKSSLSDFIVNEASDYEILNFAYTGKFPSEKYNTVNESELIEAIKFELDSNSFDLIESGLFTEDSVEELSESLVPLSEFGLSSSKTILEHLSNTGVLKTLLTEKGLNWRKSFGGKAFGGVSKKDVKAGISNIPKNTKDMAGEAKKTVSGAGKDISNLAKIGAKKVETAASAIGKKTAKVAKDVAKKTNMQKSFGKGAFKGTTFKSIQQGGQAAVNKINKISNNVASKITGGAYKPETIKAQAKSASDAKQKLMKVGKGVGATVIAGALLYGAYKTYKRFFSKAARACSGQSGTEKTACMEKFKINAKKAQIADLKKAKVACKNSSNPQRCSAAIDAKIAKLNS